MLDTGLPSLDNNAIDTDSLVKRDELVEETTPSTPITTTEGLDDVVTTSSDNDEDTRSPADEDEASGPKVPENVNENESSSSSSSSQQDEDTDAKDDSNGEINESIVVNQNAEDAVEELEELLEKRQELQDELQMQALVDSVEEKLSIDESATAAAAAAVDTTELANEEHLVDEVEKILSSSDDNVPDNEDETIEEATQKPFNQDEKHSLREDVSSSDDDDDDDEEDDSEEKEKDDSNKNEGLESEWGDAGASIVSLDDKNILTNEIDGYESVPIDLSNDIAVNDIMADQAAPVNPDAELFDVEELTSKRLVADGEESARLEVLAALK